MDTLQQKSFKVLIIGDDCTDIYQYGYVDRISPEAPVPILNVVEEVVKPGMAGNVRENLVALGIDVNYLHGNTSKRTRVIDKRSKQHIVRIDEDLWSEPLEIVTKLPPYDAIVISDYNKGTVDYDLIQDIISSSDVPVFIDTKKPLLHKCEGAIVKINSIEWANIETSCSNTIVTYGAQGVFFEGNVYSAIPTDVVDVTGAGDTFLAALVYDYLHTKDLPSAIKFAIAASTATIQHVGVHAPTLEEINEIIDYRAQRIHRE